MKRRGKGKKTSISCKERSAFLVHRWGAKKSRNIDFCFTYEEWINWWETNLGPDWFKKRGLNSRQYVMARFGDKGPYHLNNVKCITASENCKEALFNKNRGNAKLTKEQVIDIYLKVKNGPRGTAMRLADKYNVNDITIRSIAKKYTWSHVTDQFD